MGKLCWYCARINDNIPDNFIGNFECQCCGVENSVYNPKQPDWLPKQGDEAMLDYNDPKYQGKYVYLPIVGETAQYEIKEIKEVKSDNPKFNFSENVPVLINGEVAYDDDNEQVFKKKDLGYHIECELISGKILSVTSLSAFLQVFKKNNIQDGETWKIFHKDKGIWKCEKI